MKAKIWVLSTVLADENAPAMPAVFADEAEAWAKYDEGRRSRRAYRGVSLPNSSQAVGTTELPDRSRSATRSNQKRGETTAWTPPAETRLRGNSNSEKTIRRTADQLPEKEPGVRDSVLLIPRFERRDTLDVLEEAVHENAASGSGADPPRD
jgi:hypothetical protein